MIGLAGLAPSLTSVEYHEGTPLANGFGLQVARAFVMNARIRKACGERPPSTHPAYDALVRTGIAVLPDFLPDDVFRAVSAEYAAARADGLLIREPCVEDNAIVEDRIPVGKNRDRFPVTYRTFADDQSLRDLVGDIIGRTPASTSLIISVMQRSLAPTNPTRLLGTNYIHADVHFPSVKAWFYLNDIDESNGAFVYAPGSHLLSWGRLVYEWEASLRVARTRRQNAGSQVANGLVRKPTASQLRRMGIREQSVVGKANTLVIANIMGFHRRGEFQPHVTRDMLMLRFGDRRVAKPAK